MSKFATRSLYSTTGILIALALAPFTGAYGQQMPAHSKGWYFYSQSAKPQYAADPVTACKNTAKNHMGTPLLAMRPLGTNGGMFDCKYEHFIGPSDGGWWYAWTFLSCDSGYVPRSPGVCVKRNEPLSASAPPAGTCGGSKQAAQVIGAPGATRGNPVQVASGAKVQTEIDLVAGPGDWLRITRTYRSLHNARGQSGGLGWSFSFDRDFTVDRGSYNTGVPIVSGSFGDGSAFYFADRDGVPYAPRYGKGMTLKPLNEQFSEWLLTTADGRIERYTKLNDTYKMTAAFAADGGFATYTYDAENRLIQITDNNGRTVKISWHGGEVAAVDGPDGGVHYDYGQAPVAGQAEIVGMARLEAVHFHDRDGALLASRRYHYEDERLRYLLTGITDENGSRFATYAYNESATVAMSEHAGGADRYTFDYP